MKKILTMLVIFKSLAYGMTPAVNGINPVTDFQNEINAERRRAEQEKIQEMQSNFNENKKEAYPLHEIEKNIEQRGSKLKKITISGNEVISNKVIEEVGKKYLGAFGGQSVINLLKELENIYLGRGYVATRVKIDMENTNFSEGVVAYKVIEGRIEEIRLKTKELYPEERISFSFPSEKGDIVYIKDLDQGIDNLNSVASNNGKFDLLPGKELGGTIIEITNEKSKRLSGSINYNNLGQKSTGEERGKISLTFSDVFGFNDTFSGTYQNKLGTTDEKYDNENFSFYYRLPYKYWEFLISKDNSEYLNTIESLNTELKSTGTSQNFNVTVKRVLNRNSKGKTDLDIGVTRKNTKNYIEDVKLITSSRILSVAKLGITNQRGFLGGSLYSSLAYHRGLNEFDAESDLGKGQDEPRAQFDKYTLDINWYKPFKIKNQNFSYSLTLGAQYSDDILYSSEKLGIGNDTTVRGYKNDSIMGDKGFYLRNELSYKYKAIEPFIAYDVGRVKDVYKDVRYKRYGEEMTGVSIGVRGYYKGFSGSVTYSKPLVAPSYIKKNPQEVYISISYLF